MQIYEVVSVPFPYVEQPIIKRRPAVVISTDTLHRANNLAWVCMITSKQNAGWLGDIEISDLEAAGLGYPSVIRPCKVATVKISNVKVIGELEAMTIAKLNETINHYMRIK